MKKLLPLLLVIMLSSCTVQVDTIQDGPVVSTPPQWTEYCEMYPVDPAC